jgi:hypothetical protein
MKTPAKQQVIMTNHQVMMYAHAKEGETCFQDIYASPLLEATNHYMEEEFRQAELFAQKDETEVKRNNAVVKKQELDVVE